jgi:hypothetical protein
MRRAGIVCTAFLFLSWAVLPVEKTHRHYLSICLAIGVTFMQVRVFDLQLSDTILNDF